MKVYIAASCISGSRGFRYEVHGAWKDPAFAEIEIKEAALRDKVDLVKCGERSWKGARAIVTIHEVEVEGEYSERPTTPDLGTLHAPRVPVLELGETPLGEELDIEDIARRQEMLDAGEMPLTLPGGDIAARAAVDQRADERASLVTLRKRVESACLMMRDHIGQPAPAKAPDPILWKVLGTLDPDRIYDNGD